MPGSWPVTSNTVTDINKIYLYIDSHVVYNHYITNFIFLSLSHLVENNDTKYYLFFIKIKKVIFWVIFASFGPPCHKKCRRSHNFCPISILLVPKCSEMNWATSEPVSALILNMSFFYPLFVPPLIQMVVRNELWLRFFCRNFLLIDYFPFLIILSLLIYLGFVAYNN